MEEEKTTKSIWIWMVILGIIITGGLYYYISSKKTSESPAVISDSSSVVAVEGGMFYFKPNEIKVKFGETVKIKFTNVEGMHDFVLDEFNVKSKKINADETTDIEFTPNKTDEFEFYCSVSNHRQMGMVGKLIVE